MMINAICYKLKTPIVYNKGTRYEKSCNTFLACYGGSMEATQCKVNQLNNDTTAKEEFCAEHRLVASSIDYFYVNTQEEFDTRGN